VLGVGGGVGIAELYPIAKAFREAGNKVISILGARNKDLLILEKEMGTISDKVLVTTDDGSAGKKGLVTDAMKELYAAGEKIDAIFTIGPIIMMKFVAGTSLPHGTPTFASLNPVMLDGTGMCGGCRVEVGGKARFACVDGPMFDAHQTNFDLLMKRTAAYREQEKISLDKYSAEHVCRIGLH
jgi:NAD(P)H-flavin reductase